MKLKDRLRLALLAAKSNRSEEENTEYTNLVTAAKAANLDPDIIADEYAPDVEGDGALSEVELKSLIQQAVKSSLPASTSAVDTDAILKAINESGKSLSIEDVETIVKANAPSFDKEGLLAEVKKLIPQEGITKSELTAAFDEFAKSMRTPSKVVHDTGSKAYFPVEHRSGNLTVAQKQLLNILVMNTSDEAIAETRRQNGGKAVPTSINDGITEEQLSVAIRNGENQIKSLRQGLAGGKAVGDALSTTNIGFGSQLMPMELSSDLQMRMYLESALAAEMLSMEIEMPTQPFEFPLVTTRSSFYTGTEAVTWSNQASNPQNSTPGTGRVQLDAKKLIGMSEYSYEADEDSIVAILPMIQNQLSTAAADAYEGSLINGDTTATHQDYDYNLISGHHAKLFKGFRKYALAGGLGVDFSTTAPAGTGINATHIIALRKKMQRWGLRPSELAIVVGPQGYNDLVGLDETLSFYKVGSQAQTRILTGEAPSIFGIRIIVSSQMREDLDSTGVNSATSANNIKGSILMFHRPSWMVGTRRGFTVEVDQSKRRQTNSVIASFRRAFTPKETPAASMPLCVLGYNYTA
jgi:HK97 family phage major capsid protein